MTTTTAAAMEKTIQTRDGKVIPRTEFEELLRRRFFFTESFEIYRKAPNFKGDNRGLFDYGPPGCALQAAFVDLWRKHFVLEENMLEIDPTMLTHEDVFKTSGHVDRFEDLMCKDEKTGDYLRADHLIENVLEARLKGDKAARGIDVAKDAKEDDPANAKKLKRKVKDVKAEKLEPAVAAEYEEILAKIDNYGQEEVAGLIRKHDIRNPDSGNEVMPPVKFNLMFKTAIGPSSGGVGYLRPETAQGQFVNFKKLLDYNQGAMPFASASIGKSFRNEISPRQGVLRVREFLMAEIEHFVDPEGGKTHERFDEVRHVELSLLDRETQLAGRKDLRRMTVGEAVSTGLVDNETLGYFLARIALFMERVGADMGRVRFRQHMANEMAHYAADCWDGEMESSYGWIECVGCADRSAYDLGVHARRTGEALVVRQAREAPLKSVRWEVDIDKKKLGPKFRKDAKAVEQAIEALDQEQRKACASKLDADGKIALALPSSTTGEIEVGLDLLKIVEREHVEHVREYTPNVIEPSFGIGRLLYSVLEHSYWHREDDVARGVLSLPPLVAPTKVLIVPLSNNKSFGPLVKELSRRFRALGISNNVDGSSSSIGKRYARNDELGTPFGITVDFDSIKDNSVTLRERDSTRQVRSSVDDVVHAVQQLVEGRETWPDVAKRLPEFTGQAGEE